MIVFHMHHISGRVFVLTGNSGSAKIVQLLHKKQKKDVGSAEMNNLNLQIFKRQRKPKPVMVFPVGDAV